MNLREFVTQTLCEIAQGVEEANHVLTKLGASANPCAERKVYGGESKLIPRLHEVSFDVAVTAEEEKETNGGAGLMVGSLGLGMRGRSESSGSTHSRVRFTIPVHLPNPKRDCN